MKYCITPIIVLLPFLMSVSEEKPAPAITVSRSPDVGTYVGKIERIELLGDHKATLVVFKDGAHVLCSGWPQYGAFNTNAGGDRGLFPVDIVTVHGDYGLYTIKSIHAAGLHNFPPDRPKEGPQTGTYVVWKDLPPKE